MHCFTVIYTAWHIFMFHVETKLFTESCDKNYSLFPANYLFQLLG